MSDELSAIEIILLKIKENKITPEEGYVLIKALNQSTHNTRTIPFYNRDSTPPVSPWWSPQPIISDVLLCDGNITLSGDFYLENQCC